MKNLLYILGAIIVVVAAVALFKNLTLTAPAGAGVAAVAAAASSEGIVGTLTYYPNNVGTQLPYIVYKTATGMVATKVLTFDSSSTCKTANGDYPCTLIKEALPSYYDGGAVRVIGTVNDEGIEVSLLEPA
jgi:hypothetical protein